MKKSKKNTYLWTKSKARLLLIKASSKATFNWIFVPGGPGLGSEYLHQLTSLLNLPGTIWHFDFPCDGSNIIDGGKTHFTNWSQALIEAICALNNVILVTHSFSGMFVLSTPKLKNLLKGLVIMSSAPNKDWLKYFQQYSSSHPIKEATTKLNLYYENRSNETLKDFVIAGAQYCVGTEGLKKYIATVEKLPINYLSYEWFNKNFHPVYKAKWLPKNIPTLIFSGSNDHLTPLSLFKNLKELRPKNITIIEIKNAGHYPWLEKPKQVVMLFKKYCKQMTTIGDMPQKTRSKF